MRRAGAGTGPYSRRVVLIVDHYDSFTWNIVHAASPWLRGRRFAVVRFDRLPRDPLNSLAPSHVILSPGPGTPGEARATLSLLRRAQGRVPVLGVCLGHQCLAEAFGLRVVRAPRPVHGKTSPVLHDRRGVFAGVASPMAAMRYHSLVVDPASVDPARWSISAYSPEGEHGVGPAVIMGLRRIWSDEDARRLGARSAAELAPMEGVQFHPESFRTPRGARLLGNFLRWRRGRTLNEP